jgi:hypothetical protein
MTRRCALALIQLIGTSDVADPAAAAPRRSIRPSLRADMFVCKMKL